MATNAEHQAAWRRRQRERIAALAESCKEPPPVRDDGETETLRNELERAREEIATLRKIPKDDGTEVESLRKELKTVMVKNTELRKQLRGLRWELRELQIRKCSHCGAPPMGHPLNGYPLLNPEWFNKFSKFANMLGSSNETERHLASDHALKMLNEAGLRWSDVL